MRPDDDKRNLKREDLQPNLYFRVGYSLISTTGPQPRPLAKKVMENYIARRGHIQSEKDRLRFARRSTAKARFAQDIQSSGKNVRDKA